MKHLSFQKPIVFIDLESTGVNPRFDRIIEICLVKVHPDGKEDFFVSLINPEITIPQDSIERHGITDADVADKPKFEELAQKIFEFVKDCDVGGFAINRFDLPLLKTEFDRVGISYNYKDLNLIDVMAIYHTLHPRDLKTAYKQYCNKDLENAHRAEADVRATIEVLESQLESHNDLPKDIQELHKFCNPKDPNWIDADGKFIWKENKVTFNFGNHAGKTLQEVVKDSPDYLSWMINKDFPEDVIKIIKNALNGIFPSKD